MNNSIDFILQRIIEREKYIKLIDAELNKTNLYKKPQRIELIREKFKAENEIQQFMNSLTPFEFKSTWDKLNESEKEIVKRLVEFDSNKFIDMIKRLALA